MSDYLPPAPSVAPALQRAVWIGLAQVLAFGLLSSIILDGGRVGAAGGIAVLGYVLGVAAIAVRRGRRPTPGDVAFVTAGFFPLVAWSFAAAIALGR